MNIFYGSRQLSEYLIECSAALKEEVKNENKNQLLNVNEVTYIEYLVNKHSIAPLNFNWAEVYLTETEELVPAQSVPSILSGGTQLPSKKQVLIYHVPFTGLHILLTMMPSTHIRWTTEVMLARNNTEISFEIINYDHNLEKIQSESKSILDNIKKLSEFSIQEINHYNLTVKETASEAVRHRKIELLKQANLLESLNIPIKKSNNNLEAFTVPIQKKQIVIQKPVASDTPYLPEPELSNQVYQEILKTCQDFGIEMERHPSTYKDKGEEALRDLFLMLLTPHFTSVTGETFNKKGKTDILIRHEGKNVFVAECKFWSGQKTHAETIDQILSYLTWRDSKSAIIYFVKNEKLQPVLDSIKNTTPQHSAYVKDQRSNGDAWLNYSFHLLNDNSRGVELSILIFHFND